MSRPRQNFEGFCCSPRYFTKVEDGCWIWNRSLTSWGYGSVYYNHKTWKAHRLIYTWYKGPVPKHLTLDHLCLNKKCVNPDHLEVTTMRENVLRADSPVRTNHLKTHCDKGHAYLPDNLILDGKNRRCRLCTTRRKQILWSRVSRLRGLNTMATKL